MMMALTPAVMLAMNLEKAKGLFISPEIELVERDGSYLMPRFDGRYVATLRSKDLFGGPEYLFPFELHDDMNPVMVAKVLREAVHDFEMQLMTRLHDSSR